MTDKRKQKKNKPKHSKARRIFGALAFLIPALIAVILYLALPSAPTVTEVVFSRGIFPVLFWIISLLNGLIPVSVTEYVIILLPLAIIITLVLLIRTTRKNRERGKRAWIRLGKTIAWGASTMMLVYMLMHGANYYRVPLHELTGITPVANDTVLLEKVTLRLAYEANEARLSTVEDERGVMKLSQKLSTTLASVGEGYDVLRNSLTFLPGGASRAKPVLMSYYWSYTGTAGIYTPFLGEASVNVSGSQYSIPFTAAHETAHTMGFAREDECNFLAFLSCINNPQADFRYSGYVMALVYCSNELAATSPEAWRNVYDVLSDGVKRDLAANTAYWKQFEGEIRDVSQSLNDSFITHQGVSDGVRSYNRVVQLILAYYGG